MSSNVSVDLSDMRKPYKSELEHFKESDLPTRNPFELFKLWFEEVKTCDKILEPNAVCLATSDKSGRPSARMVLLKGFDEKDGFKIFTNLGSRKGIELKENPNGYLLFYWDFFNRQIRIEGSVEFTSQEESEAYFKRRPRQSQLGAYCSDQSKPIESLEKLQEKFENAKVQFEGKDVEKPLDWGGIKLFPKNFEFWQGQSNRLHDRIVFSKDEQTNQWILTRLQP